MPKRLEQKLLRQASSLGYTGRRKDAFVYGTMRKTGWTPEHEKRSQTEAMVRQLRLRK